MIKDVVENAADKKQFNTTITEFLTKIAKQDNRGTASPYFYVIRTSSWITAQEEHAEKTEYRCEDSDMMFDSEEEARKYYIESECDEDEVEKKVADLSPIHQQKVWNEECMFLTDEEAKRHLKSNYYHYSKDAHTYVKHCWRAPDLKEFIQALYGYFNVEKGNLDL